jgi:hypothetical protein
MAHETQIMQMLIDGHEADCDTKTDKGMDKPHRAYRMAREG